MRHHPGWYEAGAALFIGKSRKKGKIVSSPFFIPVETYFLALFFFASALGFSVLVSLGLGSGFFAMSVHL
jgi:hypothetical protein